MGKAEDAFAAREQEAGAVGNVVEEAVQLGARFGVASAEARAEPFLELRAGNEDFADIVCNICWSRGTEFLHPHRDEGEEFFLFLELPWDEKGIVQAPVEVDICEVGGGDCGIDERATIRQMGAVPEEQSEEVEEIWHAADDAGVVIPMDGGDEVVRALRARRVAEAGDIPVPGEGELLGVVEGGEVEEMGVPDVVTSPVSQGLAGFQFQR